MQKMLQSYAGLEKKYVTDGPWAQIDTTEQQHAMRPLETQQSVASTATVDFKDDQNAHGDRERARNISDVTYARLQLKNSLSGEKPFKVEYHLEVPEALRNRVNRAYQNFI
jgi:hypothetical protein